MPLSPRTRTEIRWGATRRTVSKTSRVAASSATSEASGGPAGRRVRAARPAGLRGEPRSGAVEPRAPGRAEPQLPERRGLPGLEEGREAPPPLEEPRRRPRPGPRAVSRRSASACRTPGGGASPCDEPLLGLEERPLRRVETRRRRRAGRDRDGPMPRASPEAARRRSGRRGRARPPRASRAPPRRVRPPEEARSLENEDLAAGRVRRALLETRHGLGERLGPVRVVAVGQSEALPEGNREEELEGAARQPVVREDGLQVAMRRARVAPPERERGALPEGGEVPVPLAERREEGEGLLERRLGLRQRSVLGGGHGEVDRARRRASTGRAPRRARTGRTPAPPRAGRVRARGSPP